MGIDSPAIRTYVNKIESMIIFKIKTEYYLELFHLNNEIAKTKITKKNDEKVPHLETTEVVLVHCNIVNNDYQQDSRILDTFVPNNSFSHLLDILSKHSYLLKNFNSELSYIEVWFTYQNYS